MERVIGGPRSAELAGKPGAAVRWTLGLTLLLGWIPFFGPFAAGFMGGRRAGTVGAAVLAALVPGLASAALLLWLGANTELPPLVWIAGAGPIPALLFGAVPCVGGAVFGALSARA